MLESINTNKNNIVLITRYQIPYGMSRNFIGSLCQLKRLTYALGIIPDIFDRRVIFAHSRAIALRGKFCSDEFPQNLNP
jgi:hypothetical protein